MQPLRDAALDDHPQVIREPKSQGAAGNARKRDKARAPPHVASARRRKQSFAWEAPGVVLTSKVVQRRPTRQAAQRAGCPDLVAILKPLAIAG